MTGNLQEITLQRQIFFAYILSHETPQVAFQALQPPRFCLTCTYLVNV